MTALRLTPVGAGRPLPCVTAHGQKAALGRGAAPASSVRVRAVLPNAFHGDFAEMRHRKGPVASYVGPQGQVTGSFTGEFSRVDSHEGVLHKPRFRPLWPQAHPCSCPAALVSRAQKSSTSGACADRTPGLTPRASDPAGLGWADQVPR